MRRSLFVLLLLAGASACSLRNIACGVPQPPDQGTTAAAQPESSPDTAGAPTIRIVFLGDSLTAGLGLLSQQSFPSLIEDMFAAEGYQVESINAGVSGDTSAGGARRVEGLLDSSTKILVVALGANDALRGLTVEQTYDNLTSILSTARSRGVAVMLCGMEAPPNLGEDYRTSFRGVYLRVLREHQGQIAYVPFLLEGVAGNPSLNQSDGIHPNADGARVIAEALYPRLRGVVDQLGHGGG